MRVIVAGAVQSTAVVLEKLVQHNVDIACVYGYQPENQDLVSGFVDLCGLAKKHGLPHEPFTRINDASASIQQLGADYIFVVGLSQLVGPAILGAAGEYCIGFHPTKLPTGRGRAPMAWMILDGLDEGAATFFRIEDGVDDGSVLAQAPFPISGTDNVGEITEKMLSAMSDALDVMIPKLMAGNLKLTPQLASEATYYEKRTPDDGLIKWTDKAESIARLVRATSYPYPGAFSYANDLKIIIHRAVEDKEQKVKGVVGRIVALNDDGSFVVQCGEGLLRVIEYEVAGDWAPGRGKRLGCVEEIEIYSLKQRLAKLEAIVSRLDS